MGPPSPASVIFLLFVYCLSISWRRPGYFRRPARPSPRHVRPRSCLSASCPAPDRFSVRPFPWDPAPACKRRAKIPRRSLLAWQQQICMFSF
ncbi:hypothetical protein D9O50_03305 [Oxalobacteraceae bacterium CAVE-383]|nr:hypothetical protein D9O50_03305 [Oxalobacteraceae bacterium CAVE-383]